MRDRYGKLNRIAVLEEPFAPTPIVRLSGDYSDNEIYIKRDDLLPFSFGGNKARKAQCFYRDIMARPLDEQPDVIVTYGSNASNHCRIIANMARSMGIDCHIIANDHEVKGRNGRELFNRVLVEDFGASVETVPTEQVHDTIENALTRLRSEGRKPYFIPGGGHGNIGTAAYYEVFSEILTQEETYGVNFSHIFLASGTGATQGGLVAGKAGAEAKLKESEKVSPEETSCHKALPEIVGISIARRNPRGGGIVRESAESFLAQLPEYQDRPAPAVHVDFDDHYILGGYGEYNDEVTRLIDKVMYADGIPMDTTYVGKAFHGMLQYLVDHEIQGKQILFIHTGGTPLFFDRL